MWFLHIMHIFERKEALNLAKKLSYLEDVKCEYGVGGHSVQNNENISLMEYNMRRWSSGSLDH